MHSFQMTFGSKINKQSLHTQFDTTISCSTLYNEKHKLKLKENCRMQQHKTSKEPILANLVATLFRERVPHWKLQGNVFAKKFSYSLRRITPFHNRLPHQYLKGHNTTAYFYSNKQSYLVQR